MELPSDYDSESNESVSSCNLFEYRALFDKVI